jgi:hypothetical protein
LAIQLIYSIEFGVGDLEQFALGRGVAQEFEMLLTSAASPSNGNWLTGTPPAMVTSSPNRASA